MKTISTGQYLVAGHPLGCKRKKGHESVSLTDLYKAAGSPSNKKPGHWRQLPDVKTFIAAQAKRSNVRVSTIIETKTGRGGGTWARWVIAIKYAAYLDKDLAAAASRTWRQLKKEERDTDLPIDTAVQRHKERYLAQGYDDKEAEQMAVERQIGKVRRNLLTPEWGYRGAHRRDFGKLTNAGYEALFNKTAAQMCEDKGLPPKTNMRDHLPLQALAQTSLQEYLTRERLRKDDVRGAAAIEQVIRDVGALINDAVARSLQSSVTDVVEVKSG